MIVTDKLKSYIKPCRNVFPRTIHISVYDFFKLDRNNLLRSVALLPYDDTQYHSEKAFSANEQYLSGLKYNNPDVRHTKAYASTGMSYQVAPNQKIGLGVGYRQANFKSSRDGLSANLGYTVQF